ncbi:hypothetical protein ABPG73_009950 [Tetrahymena malaccensis]
MASKKENHDYLYKIIMVGDPRVGKTSFLIRYIKGVLPKSPMPTIGVEYLSKQVLLSGGEGIVKAQIWDMSGSEKYKSISVAHYRKSVGALLFFDLTELESFKNTKKWLQEIENHTEEGIKIMLIGNKLDLIEEDPSQRKVDKQEVIDFAKKHNLIYEETSAVSGKNVKESFQTLIETIYKDSVENGQDYKPKPPIDEKPIILDPANHGDKPKQPNDCCCN